MRSETPPRARARLDVVLASWRFRWKLTTAETDVARDVIRGLSNKEIARRHGVASSTIRTQVGKVLAKTRAESRTHLAYLAFCDADLLTTT